MHPTINTLELLHIPTGLNILKAIDELLREAVYPFDVIFSDFDECATHLEFPGFHQAKSVLSIVFNDLSSSILKPLKILHLPLVLLINDYEVLLLQQALEALVPLLLVGVEHGGVLMGQARHI